MTGLARLRDLERAELLERARDVVQAIDNGLARGLILYSAVMTSVVLVFIFSEHVELSTAETESIGMFFDAVLLMIGAYAIMPIAEFFLGLLEADSE